MVTDLMYSGRRDKDSESLLQLERLEDHMGGAVAPAALEAVEEAAVRKE